MRTHCQAMHLSKTEPIDEGLLLSLVQHIATDARHTIGYRAVYAILRSRYAVRASQAAVRIALKLAFPEEASGRAKSALRRREYNGRLRTAHVTCVFVFHYSGTLGDAPLILASASTRVYILYASFHGVCMYVCVCVCVCVCVACMD